MALLLLVSSPNTNWISTVIVCDPDWGMEVTPASNVVGRPFRCRRQTTDDDAHARYVDVISCGGGGERNTHKMEVVHQRRRNIIERKEGSFSRVR